MRTTRPSTDHSAADESARTPRPHVRHGRQKRHSLPRTLVKAAATVSGVGIVASISIVAIAATLLVQSAQPSVSLHPIAAGSEVAAGSVPEIGALEGGFNVLVVGSDSRQGQGDAYGDPDEETSVLNDVNMLMHVSADHSNATVVSFPRDMYVDIPSCVNAVTGETIPARYDTKINEAMGKDVSLGCVAGVAEELLGVRVDYGAVVQFNGVIEMSNAIGGVDVCVATEIADPYTNTYLEPGVHSLEGMAALQFLRSRHGIGDGSDLTRISNQQVFLSSLVRQVKSADTLLNPVALYGLAKAALGNMTLSTELNNVNTLVQMGLALKDVDIANVVFAQYPTGSVSGGVVPDRTAGDVLATALQTDQPIALTGGTGAGATTSGEPAAPAATEAPAAGPATTDPLATAEATPGATAAPGTPAAGAPVELPEAITGQPADQQTCSVGFFG
ncbi:MULTISPECIES: LCP family protein [unclassified Rathayibacter]|uniref:LCP family protein n=1 Tax=unclassified Rathayibacter TaxID=2609250 RepID=UPI000F4B44F9|nr:MULTISPECIES: LCP family protein [unclassified Rathayibacter]MCJ1705071.1 LCP family protein [Rathayibacter sp. VKM Ac-2926]ROP57193.1 LytR family transcriptional attenuator [Rathayibacter sp. PhB186]ROS55578.1 LytR family transcriptional attenuator [Rathayibacter sp. PhB185]TCL84972.1 LytR family transcriptional attenuator [Rathayibacter sp. PhB192]TCM30690.1 LytR family transcriptional attenuator [Rathayibacter sp. PhB179]